MNLRQWIVKQSALYKDVCKHKEFSEDICICSPYIDGVQVYEGIEAMAEEAGQTLETDMEKDICLFEFNGVIFFQLLHRRDGNVLQRM